MSGPTFEKNYPSPFFLKTWHQFIWCWVIDARGTLTSPGVNFYPWNLDVNLYSVQFLPKTWRQFIWRWVIDARGTLTSPGVNFYPWNLDVNLFTVQFLPKTWRQFIWCWVIDARGTLTSFTSFPFGYDCGFPIKCKANYITRHGCNNETLNYIILWWIIFALCRNLTKEFILDRSTNVLLMLHVFF